MQQQSALQGGAHHQGAMSHQLQQPRPHQQLGKQQQQHQQLGKQQQQLSKQQQQQHQQVSKQQQQQQQLSKQQQQQVSKQQQQHQQLSKQQQQHQQLSKQQQQQFQAARHKHMEQQVTKPRNSFERIMLRLEGLFSNYNKVQLTGFLKEVRTANNGSLSGLSVDEIVRRVDELVRQRRKDTSNMASQRMQVKGNSQGLVSRPSAAPPATFSPQGKRPTGSFHPAPTPATPAWGAVGVTFAEESSNWHKELVDGEEEEEDPCVICHEEMSGDNIQELQCGHIFHARCITEWLKQQNTCPFCRTYTILKTDYPNLGK